MDYVYLEKLAQKFQKLAQWAHDHAGHRYDPHCRCEECQNKEFEIQSKIEEEKQLERDRKEKLYGKDDNDANDVTLPQQRVEAIPTADLERVMNHTLDSLKREDPSFGYWYRTMPAGNSYKITMAYHSDKGMAPQYVQSALSQVFSLKWPGTDFSFDIQPNDLS